MPDSLLRVSELPVTRGGDHVLSGHDEMSQTLVARLVGEWDASNSEQGLRLAIEDGCAEVVARRTE